MPRRVSGDGNPSGNRETRRPPAATPAPPPAAAWKAARPALTAMTVGVDPTVDGLRAHAHGGVVGERDARPAADGRRRPRPGHSATRAHRRPHDGRWRLRGLARLRTALRRAGSAMQHPPVHGPVLSRFGRHGRQDPFSSDGNPRVAFGLPAGRRGVAAGHQTDPADAGAVADLDLDDPAFPFRQVRTYFSHRCNIPSDWLSGQSPI